MSRSGATAGGYPLNLTGATAATRYVGGTSSGPPVSGTFAAGDFVVDLTGVVWVCTTAGSPGTWTAQARTELAYTQVTSNSAQISVTTYTTIAAFTTSVTVGARPIEVQVYAGGVLNNTGSFVLVMNVGLFEDGTQVAQWDTYLPAVAFADAGMSLVARRNPSAGSHTYTVQAKVGSTSQQGFIIASATNPAFLRVNQL